MWWLGFILHEAGLNLLLIFLPLYVVAIGGTLIDVGVMFMLGQLSTIPASILWGYTCDRTRRYKIFILLSFLSLAVITYSFVLVASVNLLIILYVLLSIFHSAHGPPKNVLIAELYTYEEWKRNFAVFEGFTEIGRLIGLFAGIVISLGEVKGLSIITLCSSLQLLAFISSIFLVRDPILILERRLIAIKRLVDLVDRGVSTLCETFNGPFKVNNRGKEDAKAFYKGLTLFQMATAALFTPMPIFLLRELALSQSSIFTMYALSSIGVVVSYFCLIYRDVVSEKTILPRTVLLRSLLTFLMPIACLLPFSTLMVAILLALLGCLYAVFNVCTLTMSMELLPPKRAGLFDAIVNLGSVCGAFVGPLIADVAGFNCVFLLSGAIFLASFAAFKAFNR